MRLATEEFLHRFLNRWHTRHTTNENHVIDFTSRFACVSKRFLTWLDCALHEVFNKALKLRTGEFDVEVLRTCRVSRDERKVHFVLRRRRQFFFGFLSFVFQTLKRHFVSFQVDAVLFFELISQIVDDTNVEVFTTKEGVAVCRQNFKYAVTDLEDGYVECTTAKVINCDRFVFRRFVEAVSQRGRCRLVDDAQNFKTGNFTSVFRRLTLSVVKVSWNRDHGLRNFLTEVSFCCLFHLCQNERRHFLRGVVFVATFDPCVAAWTFCDLVRNELLVFLNSRIAVCTTDQTFDRKEGLLRVGDGLAPCRHADQTFTTFSESNNGWRCACTFSVFNYLGILAVHNGDTGVCRTKVDTNNFSHSTILWLAVIRPVGWPASSA